MEPGLTALEVIGMAVRSEENAARFYGRIAKMIGNGLVREKYRHLAKEETKHKEMLVGLYCQMSGSEDPPPRIPGEPETAEGGAIPEELKGSMEELLRLAIQNEQEAGAFYQEAANQAMDPSGARILRYLADVENGHEKMLRKELEAYLRDRKWYLGEEGSTMVHVGP
jgi:rubrerythrin